MPASAPWLDLAAPPQYAYYQSGVNPAGPVPGQALQPATGGTDSGAYATFSGFLSRLGFGPAPLASGGVQVNANNNQVDTTLHWKLSGTIILALLVIFGVTAMGFRFVSSANLSLGR